MKAEFQKWNILDGDPQNSVIEIYFSFFSTQTYVCWGAQKACLRQFFVHPKQMFDPSLHNNAFWRLWNIINLKILSNNF